MTVGTSWFEISVADLKRAMDFYSHVFGVKFEVENTHGNEMAIFPNRIGALAKGDSYKPSKSGTRIYLNVESVDEVIKRAMERKGKVLFPKTSVGVYGFVAEIEDSEGNCIALSSMH
jgi:uncharacterized protein